MATRFSNHIAIAGMAAALFAIGIAGTPVSQLRGSISICDFMPGLEQCEGARGTATEARPLPGEEEPVLTPPQPLPLSPQVQNPTTVPSGTSLAVKLGCGNGVCENYYACPVMSGKGVKAVEPENQTNCPKDCAPKAVADVVLGMAGPKDVKNGALSTYVLSVKNLGPSAAENVLVSFSVPATFVLQKAQSDTACKQLSSGVINCAIPRLVAKGQPRSIRIAVKAGTTVCNNKFETRATATASMSDPKPNNNSAVLAVLVRCGESFPNCGNGTCNDGETADLCPQDCHAIQAKSADLSVMVDGPMTQVVSGSAVRYTLAVTNQGPSTVVDVTTYFGNPSSFFLKNESSDPSCRQENAPFGRIVCKVTRLESGQTQMVHFDVNIGDASCGTPVNTEAMVTASMADANPNNNRKSFSLNVGCLPAIAPPTH